MKTVCWLTRSALLELVSPSPVHTMWQLVSPCGPVTVREKRNTGSIRTSETSQVDTDTSLATVAVLSLGELIG